MTAPGFALFDTPIGRCAIAWGERGVVGVQLPEASEARTLARMRRRFPDTPEAPPPAAVERAIEAIVALLQGEAIDLSAITLDMEHVPPFERRVYEVARTIPPGATLAYGDIAARLGAPGEAREVGQALGQNPFPIVVPCHRVLAAGGKVGGFSANGGIATKLRLLTIEGARTSPSRACSRSCRWSQRRAAAGRPIGMAVARECRDTKRTREIVDHQELGLWQPAFYGNRSIGAGMHRAQVEAAETSGVPLAWRWGVLWKLVSQGRSTRRRLGVFVPAAAGLAPPRSRRRSTSTRPWTA